MSKWKKDKPTKGALYMRGWLETPKGLEHRKKAAETARKWRTNNKERFHANQKHCYDKVRLEVLQKYSSEIPSCSCCGEKEFSFLCLDHINNDGAAHRRQIGMQQGMGEQKHKVNIGGNGLPYWLKKNNYPEGFQVLCYNCNNGKRINNGICPHKKEQTLTNVN